MKQRLISLQIPVLLRLQFQNRPNHAQLLEIGEMNQHQKLAMQSFHKRVGEGALGDPLLQIDPYAVTEVVISLQLFRSKLQVLLYFCKISLIQHNFYLHKVGISKEISKE